MDKIVTPKALEPGEERLIEGIPFIWIPEGGFIMGSPDSEEKRYSDEGPQHRVSLDGFWMGKYQITQGQWKAIMGNNPSYFENGENYLVEGMSWNDTQAFIKKLNARGKAKFRLPTEAEWEYAARAGTTTLFYFGNTISSDTQANFDGNRLYGDGQKGVYRGKTTPVGIFPANAFGLYDMHGNLFEWCQDWYDEGFYASAKATQRNPICKNRASSERVIRGGSWCSYAWGARSASRFGLAPVNLFNNLGARLVVTQK